MHDHMCTHDVHLWCLCAGGEFWWDEDYAATVFENC